MYVEAQTTGPQVHLDPIKNFTKFASKKVGPNLISLGEIAILKILVLISKTEKRFKKFPFSSRSLRLKKR